MKTRLALSLTMVGIMMLGTSDARMNSALSLPTGGGLQSVSPNADFGRIPLYFIPNQGQVDGQVAFYAKTSSYTLWLTEQGLIFDSVRRRAPQGSGGNETQRTKPGLETAPGVFENDTSRLIFIGAAPRPRSTAGRLSGHRVNYFHGNDPAQWRTEIPTSLDVLYPDLYPDIDLSIYGKERAIEYDWIVKPGGRPEAIRFAYRDMRTTRLDREGNIVVETSFGPLVHRKPHSFQDIEGRRIPVDSRFTNLGDNTYGFMIGEYDGRYPLTIDPVILVYSTFLGGAFRDEARSIAVDKAGCAYVAGFTESSHFPLKNPADGSIVNTEAFLTKFAASGTELIYSSFLGGSGADEAYGVAVGSDRSAYVVGRTNSTNFPITSGYCCVPRGGWDIFVAQFSPSGSVLTHSTYWGGTGTDYGFGIAVDAGGAVYVAGCTSSRDIGGYGAFYKDHRGGMWDGYVWKMTRSWKAVFFATYWGGSGDDVIYDIALDDAESVYLTGSTDSDDFPVANAFRSTKKTGKDIFVTKFNPYGDAIAYSTFLGGKGDEEGLAIAVDATRTAYVTGHTTSADFPIKYAYDPIYNGKSSSDWDAFITKFTPSGHSLVFSTYLGGAGSDEGRGIAVLGDGTIYVAGTTYSKNFPLLDPYDSKMEMAPDVFIAKFTAKGEELVFSTYLGGSDSGDWCMDLALHSGGTAFVTGYTHSFNFPLKNAFDHSYNGTGDAFVTRLRYEK